MSRPSVSRTSSYEPFPALNHLNVGEGSMPPPPVAEEPKNRRRRTSSNLPGDLRGDTGGAALATMTDQKPLLSSATVTRTPSEKAARPFAKGYKRRKAKSLLRRWKSLSVRHTWLNPLILVLFLLSLYAVNPTEQNPLHRAIFISYPVPGTNPVQYAKGANDFAFVAFYTVVLSFTREFLIQRVVRPLAIYLGIRSRAKQSRFMEQAYTAIYFGIFGPYGLYVMSRTPVWYFNPQGMYEGFPHKQHEGVFKAYYLLQAAYWAQQAIVLMLQLEKPRKDFKELVAHHVVTLALIWLSYRFHFAYLGLAVYITHDISDFFLATSKSLNYIDSPLTPSFFTLFVVVWTYLRHYINLRLIWSVLTEFETVGPFELNWETQQYKCRLAQVITFSLLASLQALNLFWFFLILRIAKRMVFDKALEDERSEDGDTSDEDEGSTEEKRKALGIKAEDVKAGLGGARVQGGPGNADANETPTVLLNGLPVEGDAHNTSRTTGRSVEIKVQDRRKPGRS